ncbi:hypothetical protein ACHAQH_000892 [Verticillium albo-atrum]
MASYKIAVIGAGLIGPRHAQTVIKNPDTELVAIVDPTEVSAALSVELQTNHYPSVTDLLASPDKPDAAIICTPNHLHVPLAKELASAGVHVLVEKPVSVDVASGKDLIQHISDTGVKALTETGGVVLINMIHEVDLLHYLFGPITSVHAEKTISQRGFDAEEGAALTLRFKSGILESFVIADTVPSPWNFESGTGENPSIPRTGQDFYRVFGTEGSLSVPDMTIWSYRGTTKSWNSDLVKEKVQVEDGTPFESQLEHFVKVIRGQEDPSCTVQAGLGALMVCQAIRQALKDNTTVQVEEF